MQSVSTPLQFAAHLVRSSHTSDQINAEIDRLRTASEHRMNSGEPPRPTPSPYSLAGDIASRGEMWMSEEDAYRFFLMHLALPDSEADRKQRLDRARQRVEFRASLKKN